MFLIRRIIVIVTICTLATAIAGCSSGPEDLVPSPALTRQDPTKSVARENTSSRPTSSAHASIPTPRTPTEQQAKSFDPGKYEIQCVITILGPEAADEIRHQGRPPTIAELAKIDQCSFAVEGKQGDREAGSSQAGGSDSPNRPRERQPVRLDPGPASTLREVRLPSPSHVIAGDAQCGTHENENCTELRWERIDGLLAGAVTTIQVSPTNPNVIYAGLDSNGMSLWKSEDSGQRWERVFEWAHASDVAINPANPSIVLYSELEEGVYRSTDSGTNWTTVIGGDQPDWVRSSNLYFKTLAFVPDSPHIAYAVASHERASSSGTAEVFRTDDTGTTWSHVGSCAGCGSVYSVAVEPTDSKALWLAGDSGIHVSRDSGETWSANLLTGDSRSNPSSMAIAIHPRDPATLLVGTTSNGVYRSTDGGQTWSAANSGLDSLLTHQMAFAPSDPNVAWLTTHDGVYRSEDMGQTWTRRDTGWAYTFTHALAVDPKNPDVAYVGNAVELHTAHTDHVNEGLHQGSGLYKTTDAGNSWHRIDQDMEESNIVAMATHPYLPFNLWVGDKAGRGAFVTTDAGDTWLHAAWRAAHYPMVFAFSRTFPAKHFLSSAVGGGELTTSSDGGKTWRSLAGGLGKAVGESSKATLLPSETRDYFHVHLHGLAVAPSDPDVLYTGTIFDPSKTEEYSMMGAVIFTSRDGGLTWKESSNGFPIETPTSLNAFVIHPTDPNTAYAMTSRYESSNAIGIYKTSDGGSNWRPVNDGLDLNTRDLQMDPLFPETLYAATGSGVYKTVDGADSWQLASTGLPSVKSYSAQEKLLFALQGSSDRGGVFDLALDPVSTLNIYAATKKGVYKTKTGGDHWYAVNFGLPLSGGNPFWHDRVLEIDATGRVVYAVLVTEKGGSSGDTHIYRAIMEPLHSLEYEFELNGELLRLESVSHISDVTLGQNAQDLRFFVAGPSSVKGEVVATIPESLFASPFAVTINGVAAPASSQGQTISFGYSHDGTSQVIITGTGE